MVEVIEKALTLHRPWPWAILYPPPDGKWIENRKWKPPSKLLGKLFALHAGKAWSPEGFEYIKTLLPSIPVNPEDHADSAIVGVARVIGYSNKLQPELPGVYPVSAKQEPWFFGPYGWILSDVVAITPVKCQGRQRLWNLNAEVSQEVTRQYALIRGNHE